MQSSILLYQKLTQLDLHIEDIEKFAECVCCISYSEAKQFGIG